jgi:hypothetical protein
MCRAILRRGALSRGGLSGGALSGGALSGAALSRGTNPGLGAILMLAASPMREAC